MKIYLIAVTAACFLFGSLAGASFHTVAELSATQVLRMSMSELEQITI